MSSNVSSSLTYLIERLLPGKLRDVGCDDAATELVEVWRDPNSRTQLISALQEAADAALERSAHAESELAREAEQLSLLSLHLVHCVELGDRSSGQLHCLRAMELARELGLPLDQLAS